MQRVWLARSAILVARQLTLFGFASVAQMAMLDSYTSGTITAVDITDTYGNTKTFAANSPTSLQNTTGTMSS
tara:strand:- start:1526 stop:1741 length:216 start_codon:yes stop_codon:yes gene_type:complete